MHWWLFLKYQKTAYFISEEDVAVFSVVSVIQIYFIPVWHGKGEAGKKEIQHFPWVWNIKSNFKWAECMQPEQELE